MTEGMLFDNADLFDAAGHLTDPGLQALTEDRLDDLGRLEAAEHLTFCDYCLARYTALVEAMPARLQQPMRDLVPQVQALMRRRSFRIFTNRYFSAAAAVVLAFLMWSAGLFGDIGAAAVAAVPETRPQTSLSDTLRDALEGFGTGMDDALAQFQTLARSGLAQIGDALDGPVLPELPGKSAPKDNTPTPTKE